MKNRETRWLTINGIAGLLTIIVLLISAEINHRAAIQECKLFATTDADIDSILYRRGFRNYDHALSFRPTMLQKLTAMYYSEGTAAQQQPPR